MEKVDNIINHALFLYHLDKNNRAEADRRFCRHNMAHFLDVARIGQIINLEEGLGIAMELVYAAALLHDLGKHIQYEDGTPHEKAGGKIAVVILRDCGFREEEINVIVSAILSHRDSTVAGECSLRGLLYRADKGSRGCFLCEAMPECDWKGGKKNLQLKY